MGARAKASTGLEQAARLCAKWTGDGSAARSAGYVLVDATARHAAAPATFLVPSSRTIAAIRPGDFVKVIFETNGRGERMWVRVASVEPFSGVLDNDPVATPGVLRGARVRFAARNIIAVMRP
jgi:uncharacterized protein YegJ (DUF2314 family)